MGQTRKVTTKGKDGSEISWKVEEIENGYIVVKEWEEKEKGKDWGTYKSKKYFTDENPLADFKPDLGIIEGAMKGEE